MQTRSKNVDQSNEPQVNRNVPDGDARPAHPVKPPPNTLESHRPTDPKYANKSQAEDQKLIDELLKMLMNGRLTEITPAHVLAASPVIRTYLINFLKNQRVEVGHFAQSFEEGNHLNKIVSEDSLPLGEIEVLINNQIAERGVIDNGSQIITIREDLWKELSHTTLLPKFRMSMEGADSHLSNTRGKIRDLPITIGPITFYVQVQVVMRSPCRLLLGLPFWALSNCHLDVYPDGYMTATLTDPNPPNETIVVQSFARNPHRDRLQESFIQEIATDTIILQHDDQNEAFPLMRSYGCTDLKSFFE